MNKTIWILNHYAGNMFIVGGGRHYYFSKYLLKNGYSPIIFCSNFDHFTSSCCVDDMNEWAEKIEEKTGVPYIFVRTRSYTSNGIDRVKNMIDYYKGVLKLAKDYAKKNGKPDIIYASSVHPLALVAGIKIAKMFNVKCVCEVRDLWPESIVEYSKRYSKRNPIIKLLYAGEKWIYKKADSIIFLEEGDYDYIREQGWEQIIPKSKVFCISNGVDLKEFTENRENYTIKDEDLENRDVFKVVYTGSIRQVNDIGLLIDTAKKVLDPKIRFLIWGRGDQLGELEKRKEKENVNNIVFKGYVDKKYVPYITSNADLNIVHNAPMKLFRFAISFNKIFDYMAAGKPIICDFSCPYNPVIMNNA